MSYIKVEGHTSLVRRVSNAIVNTDKNAYQIYMQRRVRTKKVIMI